MKTLPIMILFMVSLCFAFPAAADEVADAMVRAQNQLIEQTGSRAGRSTDLTSASSVIGLNALASVASDGIHFVEVGAFSLSNGNVYPFFGSGPAVILAAALSTGRTVSLELADYQGITYARIVQIN